GHARQAAVLVAHGRRAEGHALAVRVAEGESVCLCAGRESGVDGHAQRFDQDDRLRARPGDHEPLFHVQVGRYAGRHGEKEVGIDGRHRARTVGEGGQQPARGRAPHRRGA
ncbi:MAG: hypothetical protein ACK55I_27295, partial [bacterium]